MEVTRKRNEKKLLFCWAAPEAVQQKVVFFVSFLSGSLIYEIFYVGVIICRHSHADRFHEYAGMLMPTCGWNRITALQPK